LFGKFLALCSYPKFIYAFFITTSLVILKRHRIKQAILIYFFMILGFLWVDFSVARILKPLIKRHRPFVSIKNVYVGEGKKLLKRPLKVKASYSFPSCHASNVGFAGFYLSFFEPLFSPFWIIFVILVGWSRIYLGVHYPLDVFAGWIYGAFWAYVFYKLVKKLIYEPR